MAKSNVIISGGSRGIGQATATLLSANYHVLSPGSKELDVRSQSSVDSYLEKHFREKDPIYALICNAGVHLSKPFLKQNLNEWQEIIDVNLTGTFRLCQSLIPLMIKNGGGRIIMISSVSGLYGEAYASAYSASKAGLIGLTKSLALEFASDQITVNAICPGWVRTDMARNQLNSPEKERDHLSATLQERWIEPEEIAGLVHYLLSDSAKAITGQAINMSAGLNI